MNTLHYSFPTLRTFPSFFIVLLMMPVGLFGDVPNRAESRTRLVDPMIGTAGHGHTFPGATLPHGMVQLSPDGGTSGWDWCSGYHFSDSSLIGFSHTHLSGTGCADLGDILLMPTVGKVQTNAGTKEDPDAGYRSRFSHADETAAPGYYSVLLKDGGIRAELTATERTGVHRYRFPKTKEANIIIDLNHGLEDQTKDASLTIVNDRTVEGYRRSSGWANDHTVYFRAEFSKPFSSFGTADDSVITPGERTRTGRIVKGFVRFSTKQNEAVIVKVGISYTSLEGARKNLANEMPHWDFDKVRRQADAAWEKALSAISVSSPDKNQKNIFYTALYHALIAPGILSDVDGSYRGMDGTVHTSSAGTMYHIFSLWDTFRGENPLMTIIEPQRAGEIAAALVQKYREYGLLPVWELASNETGTMIGYHAVPVIADAYRKGIRTFDAETAFAAMKKSALQRHLGLGSYIDMGFIPSDLEHESVSKTLEYAYDDWCIAMMAKELGKKEDERLFLERSKYYSNLFDRSTRLFRPKKNGRWLEPFDPYSVSGNYTEANAWQYSFFVPHDIRGLIALMGGDADFSAKLDELFTTDPKITGRSQPDISGSIGQYAHGNEPSHHMAYLYAYAGQPWKTQQRVHQILTTLYTTGPEGLCGNEDCGQMSAWFVLSSAGFYPVCPGSNQYVIGTPLFDTVRIPVGNGRTFTVIAKNRSEKNFYVRSATLNGAPLTGPSLNHSDITSGSTLVLQMGPEPTSWGSTADARPVTAVDIPFVQVPALTSGERVFRDSLVVSISAPDAGAEVLYSLDGSDPLTHGTVYRGPFTLRHSTVISSLCRKDGSVSKTVSSAFNMVPSGRSVTLAAPYHHSYTGGGPLGLIDSIRGSLNFRTDAWQGYEGVDLDAVIDLGSVRSVTSVAANFLQNLRSWIFFPTRVEYYLSEDGKNFTPVFTADEPLDEHGPVELIKEFTANTGAQRARYVKVVAKNPGIVPAWHPGAGGKSWIFIDEITIR